jgi:hypothetical protein
MALFIRLTALVAAGVVALVVLAFVLKIVIFAAIVAALVIGGLAIWKLFQRRRGGVVIAAQRRYPS